MEARKIEVKSTPERERYYQKLKQQSLAPLWERLNILLTPEPAVKSLPCHWQYESIRSLLLESAVVISAREAERRVLILDNPGLDGASAITETLYAGWQLLMPGEIAPAHRHSPSALRFILEGDGRAYTSVNGERAYMSPGDMILTPSGKWHDHGHEGVDPVIWLDVLDMPLIRNLGPVFLELFPEDRFPDGAKAGANRARYGKGLRPIHVDDGNVNSPMFHYPYNEMRAALLEVAAAGSVDPYVGVKLEYINPITGRSALATISTFLQWLPGGTKTKPYQSTEGMVFSVVEGSGSVRICAGEQEVEISWKPRDTFVIPCWAKQSWKTESDAIVFCASDKVVQERIGVWRERR